MLVHFASVENRRTTVQMNSSAIEMLIKQPQFSMPMTFFPRQQTKPERNLMVVPTYRDPIMSISPFGTSATNIGIMLSLFHNLFHH